MAPPYAKEDVIVEIDKVCLELGGKQILRDVSVEIKNITRPDRTQGQIVGFLGPSGVGKTKLFEIMAGLLEPTSGTVRIGSPLQPIHVGRVGVVQQNYPLFQHRTVLGNLLVAAAMNANLAPADRPARARTILERFGLYAHRDHYPAQLSGGQRQRIAIAQQLICSETYLLLDEPFSGLPAPTSSTSTTSSSGTSAGPKTCTTIRNSRTWCGKCGAYSRAFDPSRQPMGRTAARHRAPKAQPGR
jgi:polar amino acid transport system ATP-binding protein/sulfate transport system ATP-binding protein